MSDLIKIAHKGLPCDPPCVEGVTFSLVEGDVFVGEATQDQADRLLRIPAFKLFGGKLPIPKKPASAVIPSDEDVDALTSHANTDELALSLGITLAGAKLQEKKDELKAALVALRPAITK